VKLFSTYRVLAFVVGVLLAFCSFVALPLRYLPTEGSDLQQLGETLSVLWVAHGWAFGATQAVEAAGLIPLLIFFMEHRVNLKVRAEHPELVTPSTV